MGRRIVAMLLDDPPDCLYLLKLQKYVKFILSYLQELANLRMDKHHFQI